MSVGSLGDKVSALLIFAPCGAAGHGTVQKRIGGGLHPSIQALSHGGKHQRGPGVRGEIVACPGRNPVESGEGWRWEPFRELVKPAIRGRMKAGKKT